MWPKPTSHGHWCGKTNKEVSPIEVFMAMGIPLWLSMTGMIWNATGQLLGLPHEPGDMSHGSCWDSHFAAQHVLRLRPCETWREKHGMEIMGRCGYTSINIRVCILYVCIFIYILYTYYLYIYICIYIYGNIYFYLFEDIYISKWTYICR